MSNICRYVGKNKKNDDEKTPQIGDPGASSLYMRRIMPT
jgi:hypothetical protein